MPDSACAACCRWALRWQQHSQVMAKLLKLQLSRQVLLQRRAKACHPPPSSALRSCGPLLAGRYIQQTHPEAAIKGNTTALLQINLTCMHSSAHTLAAAVWGPHHSCDGAGEAIVITGNMGVQLTLQECLQGCRDSNAESGAGKGSGGASKAGRSADR